MEIYEQLLLENKAWAEERQRTDPKYFSRLAEGQRPEILWIGCSDSRVPEHEITNRRPGEIFVHRNIANMVVHTDMNLLSVLDFAVNLLQVKHIIVCGHYLCGGVEAAMQNKQHGLVDNWIRGVRDVYRLYETELNAISDPQMRFDRLVELNVYEQVLDVAKTSIVQNAWSTRTYPIVHGWVFDIRTGLIKDTGVHVTSKTPLPRMYRLNPSE